MKYEMNGDRIVDLSHTLEPEIPRLVGFPNPEMALFRDITKGDVINSETITLCPHTGTHIDAPLHFINDAESVDKMPPDCVLGPAVVADMRHKQGSVPIERSDIEDWENKTGEEVRPGDALLLWTDFSRFWKTGPEGQRFVTEGWPYVTRSFVELVLERQVRLVGVESMDIDLIDPFDITTSEFVGHRNFLANGVHIIENLTNMEQIGKTRCFIIATPLKIKGATGSPLRVIALV